MNFRVWKECREIYTRSYTIHYWVNFKLRLLKWYFYHLWFKLTKYKHKHIWNNSIRCYICRKTKMDLDRENMK